MRPFILAIDIGTSGAKLMLLNRDTGQTESISASYPTHVPAPGQAQQQPQHWWQAVCEGLPALLRKARVTPDEIAVIGVDGISWAPVFLDQAGRVLCDAPLWYDTRATEECRDILEAVTEEEILALNGNPVQPYYILPKLKWLQKHEPEAASRLSSVLTVNGYLVYCLTGQKTHDMVQAYGWPFFDMARNRWDENMAERLGMDLDLLPPLYESTAIVGEVTAEAARACGLKAGIPVIAGALDAACGAIGAGVWQKGLTHEQSGSAEGMSICDDAFHPVRNLILSRHVVPGTWLLQGGSVAGANLIRWLTDLLFPKPAPENAIQQMMAEAERTAPGADGLLFLPYMAGERSPVWNPDAKGVFFGLDYSMDRGRTVRAVMEGVAFALRHNLECARAAGTEAGTLRAVGGAAFNPLWMQIKADITGCEICAVDCRDATGVGCAVTAGVGAGLYGSFEEACSALVKTRPVYTPRKAYAEYYNGRYQRYLELYEQLKCMMKE